MTYISGLGFVSVRDTITPPPSEYETWWCADDKRYANHDPWTEFEQPSGSHLVIEFTPYAVVKHTPKGVVLTDFFGLKFFVLGKAIRQKAVPTKQLALQDLVARKKKHVAMSERRLNEAREHLNAAKALYDKTLTEGKEEDK